MLCVEESWSCQCLIRVFYRLAGLSVMKSPVWMVCEDSFTQCILPWQGGG